MQVSLLVLAFSAVYCSLPKDIGEYRGQIENSISQVTAHIEKGDTEAARAALKKAENDKSMADDKVYSEWDDFTEFSEAAEMFQARLEELRSKLSDESGMEETFVEEESCGDYDSVEISMSEEEEDKGKGKDKTPQITMIHPRFQQEINFLFSKTSEKGGRSTTDDVADGTTAQSDGSPFHRVETSQSSGGLGIMRDGSPLDPTQQFQGHRIHEGVNGRSGTTFRVNNAVRGGRSCGRFSDTSDERFFSSDSGNRVHPYSSFGGEGDNSEDRMFGQENEEKKPWSHSPYGNPAHRSPHGNPLGRSSTAGQQPSSNFWTRPSGQFENYPNDGTTANRKTDFSFGSNPLEPSDRHSRQDYFNDSGRHSDLTFRYPPNIPSKPAGASNPRNHVPAGYENFAHMTPEEQYAYMVLQDSMQFDDEASQDYTAPTTTTTNAITPEPPAELVVPKKFCAVPGFKTEETLAKIYKQLQAIEKNFVENHYQPKIVCEKHRPLFEGLAVNIRKLKEPLVIFDPFGEQIWQSTALKIFTNLVVIRRYYKKIEMLINDYCDKPTILGQYSSTAVLQYKRGACEPIEQRLTRQMSGRATTQTRKQ